MEPEMLALLGKTITLMEGLGYLWVVNTGLELNLWLELAEPASLEDLFSVHPSWDKILLDHWLEQAYCLDLLSKKGSKYCTTKLGQALETYRDHGLEAMYKEFTAYWGPCFEQLPALIRQEVAKQTLQSHLEEELISRASLASEPFVLPFLHAKCKEEHWHRVLDIGCGEGTYLQKLLESFEWLEGVGIEINPVVAERAKEQGTKFGSRLHIICTDALELSEDLGTFDVCLLNNNIYYFNDEQRVTLLKQLKRYLAKDGELGILTALRESDYRSRVFRTHLPQNLMSFFLACHHGFKGLPTEAQIKDLLSKTGFVEIKANPLALRTSFYFFARSR